MSVSLAKPALTYGRHTVLNGMTGHDTQTIIVIPRDPESVRVFGPNPFVVHGTYVHGTAPDKITTYPARHAMPDCVHGEALSHCYPVTAPLGVAELCGWNCADAHPVTDCLMAASFDAYCEELASYPADDTDGEPLMN